MKVETSFDVAVMEGDQQPVAGPVGEIQPASASALRRRVSGLVRHTGSPVSRDVQRYKTLTFYWVSWPCHASSSPAALGLSCNEKPQINETLIRIHGQLVLNSVCLNFRNEHKSYFVSESYFFILSIRVTTA